MRGAVRDLTNYLMWRK